MGGPSLQPFAAGGDDLLALPDYAAFRESLAKSGCRRCALAAGRATIVVDRGNPGARLLAVGEAPGAEEDRRGLAFIGRGGRLFDLLMREAGLDTNRDFLIANVVKCRPPENRVPAPEEARACLPYLRRQIELVHPAGIVLLGATAVKWLLPHRKGTALGEIVGRPFADEAFPGVRFLVLWHPAYLLRNPGKLPVAREHVKLVRSLAP